ncbi:transporter substrate-binding domain-containing protein [Conchiformibius steedae]|uniref:Solute-binding protein family 3/N-terminal domain-containing protein n=1 Tax=Conchiformibius steedae TaxID=153493 RepID=A0A3P2AA53_9NEIS|nr:transporter substrate-binding domain-containing protein [Conchiformibius steedae]RRD91636.1 hypothetical protein EII21_01010 [Conchiformibius steedae]
MILKRIGVCLTVCLLLGACNDAPPEVASTASASASAARPDDEFAVERPPVNPKWPTYLVGTETTYAPFEFRDSQGNPVGFEIDLLYAIAQNQQFNITILPNKRKDAQHYLDTGRHHIWVSAFQIGVDIDADYTDSLMDFYRVVAVLEHSPLKTAADLKQKIIAVNKNSSQETLNKAVTLTGTPDKVSHSETFVLAIHAVQGDKADGVLGDVNMLRAYDKDHAEVKFRYITINDPVGHIGFAVKKGNKELQRKLNQGLSAVKANGTYDALVKKWFGH